MVWCVGSVSIAGDDSCMSHSGTQLNSNNSDDIQNYVENVLTGPLALPRYTVANLLLIPVDRYPYRIFAVTDGAGNRWAAISNGTTWRYLDGTAV